MSLRAVVTIGLILGSAGSVFADEYEVTVDTSSLSGTSGSIDFQFNPGPLVTQSANLDIFGFSTDGTLTSCSANFYGACNTGDVTGTLPGTLMFDNGTVFNDYFDDFTFGTTLSFDVDLYGPAITSPDGTSSSGSTFAFSMFSDAAGTVPALTSDTMFGVATQIDVNLDGSTSVTNNSTQATVGPVTSVAAPEPSGVLELLVLALLVLGWFWRHKAEGRVFNRLAYRSRQVKTRTTRAGLAWHLEYLILAQHVPNMGDDLAGYKALISALERRPPGFS